MNNRFHQNSQLSNSTPRGLLVAALLLLISIPFDYSLQLPINTIVLGVLTFYMFKPLDSRLIDKSKTESKLFINNKLSWALLCLLGYYFSVSAGGLLNNPDLKSNSLTNFLIDHIFFIAIPVMFSLVGGAKVISNFKIKRNVLITILATQFFMVLFQLSTNAIEDLSLSVRGFYPSTSTLAICLCLTVPLVVVSFFQNLKSNYWFFAFLMVLGTLVFVNHSILLVLAAVVMLCNIIVFLKGANRALWLSCTILLWGFVLYFNPISFINQPNFSTPLEGPNRLNSSATDSSKPIGEKLNKIESSILVGYGPLKNKRLHLDKGDQYTEILMEGGVLGLLCFLGFFVFILSNIKTEIHTFHIKAILGQTIVIFLITGLYYNSFKSEEVRQLLMVIITWIMAKTTMEAEFSEDSKALAA